MYPSAADIFQRLSNARILPPLLARAFLDSTAQASFPVFSRNMTSAVGLPVVYHPAYSAPVLPSGHQFPMQIFRMIYTRLLQKGTIQPSQVQIPEYFPTVAELCLVHDAAYVDSFCKGQLDTEAVRRIGLPMSPLLVTRTLAEVAGTLLTAELALKHGLACNTAGGTHHAFRGHGSGYCIINDIAVTSAVLLARNVVDRVLVVDLDVHQNFPARKEVGRGGGGDGGEAEDGVGMGVQKSDLDVAVPAGTGDDAYLQLLAHHLLNVLNTFRPDLVLYDAGVDTHVNDSLGKLCMTDQGLYRREMQVLDTCVGFGIPVAGLVGGGYSKDTQELAARHCVLHEAASEVWSGHRL